MLLILSYLYIPQPIPYDPGMGGQTTTTAAGMSTTTPAGGQTTTPSGQTTTTGIIITHIYHLLTHFCSDVKVCLYAKKMFHFRKI